MPDFDPRAARLGREHDELAAEVRARLARRRALDRALVDAALAELRGGFSPPLHRALQLLAEPALGAALGPPGSGLNLWATARARLVAQGPLDALRALARRGTLVYAPTHSSSFDTVVVALTLARAGLPPGVYPADRHMFRNRLLGWLIKHLGGWRVDRGRTDHVYWLVVVEYCAVLLERGFHSVVFPGGTRSRTNAVETELKLGLLRAALRAQHSGLAARPLYVVPVTLNHQVVFEAQWLVGYQLSGRGHERVVGDELLAWGRLRKSARRLAALEQKISVCFGDPLPLSGCPAHDTLGLAAEVVRAYHRLTVLFPTHLAAAALYQLLAQAAGTDEVQRLLGRRDAFEAGAVHAAVASVLERVRAEPELGRLDGGAEALGPSGIVAAAERAFASCHQAAVLRRAGGRLAVGDVGLLWFYRNRVTCLARAAAPPAAPR